MARFRKPVTIDDYDSEGDDDGYGNALGSKLSLYSAGLQDSQGEWRTRKESVVSYEDTS